MTFTGADLKAWREARRLTQTTLGERLGGETPIPRDTISKWERGVLGIQHPTILRLALYELDRHIDDES